VAARAREHGRLGDELGVDLRGERDDGVELHVGVGVERRVEAAGGGVLGERVLRLETVRPGPLRVADVRLPGEGATTRLEQRPVRHLPILLRFVVFDRSHDAAAVPKRCEPAMHDL
jgi:hypothetical protein